jgi:methyl-accepting chemotaxis protein
MENSDALGLCNVSVNFPCRLETWLSADASRMIGAGPVVEDCLAKCGTFHREAGLVAKAINARNMPQAAMMIAAGTPYADASVALGGALVRLMMQAVDCSAFVDPQARATDVIVGDAPSSRWLAVAPSGRTLPAHAIHHFATCTKGPDSTKPVQERGRQASDSNH